MKKSFLILFMCMLSQLYAYSPFKFPKNCRDALIFFENFNWDREKCEYFYIDDINQINELSKKWDLKETVPALRYLDSGISTDYYVHLYADGKLKKVFNMSARKGIFQKSVFKLYKFDPELFSEIKQSAKRTEIITEAYENVQDYRDALNNYRNRPDFIFYDSNNCNADNFEGSFIFTSKTFNWYHVEIKIKRKYPKEKFSLAAQNGYIYTIYCNKSLYDSFALYPKEEFQPITDITLYVHLK